MHRNGNPYGSLPVKKYKRSFHVYTSSIHSLPYFHHAEKIKTSVYHLSLIHNVLLLLLHKKDALLKASPDTLPEHCSSPPDFLPASDAAIHKSALPETSSRQVLLYNLSVLPLSWILNPSISPPVFQILK